MVYKRSFHDEESFNVASKHPRQQECTTQQPAVLEISPWKNTLQKPHADGEGENNFGKSENEGRITSVSVSEDLNGADRDSGLSASGSISSYLCANSKAIDEYSESHSPIYLSFFPNYFDLDHRVTALVQPDDIYSTLLDQPPRKLVSVGPDHQADIPEWVPQGFKNNFDCLNKSDAHVYAHSSYSCLVDDDDDYRKKLMGTCVIPMPDLESPAYNSCVGEGGRSDCTCFDRGSVSCVRQHIMEARAKQKENLGEKIYEELGFSNMGEEVARKWSGEEELAFHEVVQSNPASLGRNFWDHLPAVFSSRERKDLVSYYFNVFMLRKRAEQNRFDPLNIDSDNDEVQRSELGMTEEDDDSAVESLADQDAFVYDQENHEEFCVEGVENEDEADTYKIGSDFVTHRVVTGEEDEGAIDDVFEAFTGNFVDDCGTGPVFQNSSKIFSNDGADHDIQDDSCTSFEYQSDRVDSCGPVDLGTDARESTQ
ncbi:uncharacterized protein LOC132315968 [Cornus florida]|uniref:uncharacterized protein LOC132315968 n=1 Tax=Cornus florida TaxID=4283 RepID=UPI00289D9D88|nr:uncharacterized protein LOC132315968 [Cornus florida]